MFRWWILQGILLITLVSCSGEVQSNRAVSPRRIVYGLTLLPSGFDPHINPEAELGIPLRQVYDTLVYREPKTKEFVPGLATMWEISEDGMIYTFKLRQDVVFHDGTPFNAQAVGANLDRITDPATGSQKALALLGSFAGYEVVDDYTIRLRLNQPYGPLMDSLSQVYLGIASPKALSDYSLKRYQFHQVGSGPFIFVEYVPGDRILLRRNPAYRWGPSFYELPKDDSVEEIEFRFFTDVSARTKAIGSGEAEIIGEIAPGDASTLTGNAAVQVVPVDIPGQPLQFLMNTRLFPTDNIVVRQALLYATNRDAIVDSVYQRFSSVAWGPLSANTLYYNREVNGIYAQDTLQAQELLASVGYQDTNTDGVLDIGGLDLQIVIVVPPWDLIPQVASQLQTQWQSLGIKVVFDPVPTLGALKDKVAEGQYNLVAYSIFGVDPALLNTFFTTNGTYNWSRFSSPVLDNILDEALHQSDNASRLDLYAQAQNIIMQNALVLPIQDYVKLNASSARLQGLIFDAYGLYPILDNVTIRQ